MCKTADRASTAQNFTRLFEPFTQADGSATRKHGGTGLGLTISRQLVELMGGDIGVESEVGKGTTFYVELTLPLDASRDPAPRTMKTVAAAASGKNLRVLAVDDHPINLELLDGLLENEGFEVTSVDGALSALEELDSAVIDGRPYSLALLDYQMPEIDGGELAKRIRADRRFDDLRLVILTSIDQALSSTERKELSIHASITKPLRRSRLFDAIDEALGLAPGERAPAKVAALTDLAAARIASANDGEDEMIPAREASAATVEATVKPDDSPMSSMASYHKKNSELTVLIVEDNPVNQMVIQELMMASGYKTMLADEGEQALQIIARGGVDFVLMDCQMPVMDGFEATIRIREIEQEQGLARMPVIAVTANAIMGDRERCLQAGMDDYVTKPIDTKRLEDAIAKHLKV